MSDTKNKMMTSTNIPDEVINAVLKHHDIAEVVGKYVHLTKQGRNLKGLCPFHSEKTPSFTVSPDKQIFNCFGCGTGGNAIKFIMEIEGYSFPESISYLAEEANIPFQWEGSFTPQTEANIDKETLLKAHELSAKWFHYVLKNSDHGKVAMNYLKNRGFSDKLIDTFQIGYAPPMWDTLTQFLDKKEFALPLMEKGGLLSTRTDGSGYVDRFRDRIMFPICDPKGKVIAFAGRVHQDDVQPKYLNTPETILFNKSKSLYHFHQARAAIRKTQTIVLFEGYADVIKAWDAGVHNGVATMGTALTEEHAAILKRNAEHIIFCYDGDDAGQSAAYKGLPMLEKLNCTVNVAVLADKMDPDDYIAEHGTESFKREIIESALSATKFRLEFLKRDHKLQTDQGKLSYIQSALTVIAKLKSPTQREHYLKELALEFDYSYEALKQELHEVRQELEKMNLHGDNKENPWNNVMNERRATASAPTLLPAYHNAEKILLSLMMHSRDITKYVEHELGDQFNVETHAVLAAYLYAFYAQDRESDVSNYLSILQNDKLESVASAISFMEIDHSSKPEVLEDYIHKIKIFPRKKMIEEKKQEMKRAEKAGELLQAAQIAKDINTLERQLKSR
jgi:DNA primase